jgi:hypothetical protein
MQRHIVPYLLPEGPRFRCHVADNAYAVMRGEKRILFSFSRLTPLTPALSPRARAGRGREIFGDVHPGRRFARPGLLSDAPNGAL